ncbi:hypothetical protein B1813_12015 [Saccharomonospora piscinae]|uniref:DUF3558 domain-containing protein n=1 Tax=Saccharomonospora piscinae TaxID=687388 RepID=A0A1V9A821_SACPI|nr:hypothetical protein B1813_12015 [Saccharomonospora piscinae]
MVSPATLAATFLILITISGCSNGECGYAEPHASAGTSLSELPATVPSSVLESASIDPCELISVVDLADVGEFDSEYKEGGGARSCFWQADFESGSGGFTFTVGVRDSQGIDTVNDIGNGVKQREVNQRAAVSTQDPASGDCVMALRLDDSSRVDVTVLGGSEVNNSCEIAEIISGILEPRLPEVP